MKRQLCLLMLFLYAFSLIFVPSLALSEIDICIDGMSVQMKNSVLPNALSVVEEEAFAGTALQSVLLPGMVVRIEERAFADNHPLEYLFVPGGIEYLPSNVLENTPNTYIVAESGSYAEQWAKINGYRIICQEVLLSNDVSETHGNLRNGKPQMILFVLQAFALMIGLLNRKKPHFRCVYEGNSMRPQERIELHPIQYRFP